jgi:methylglutaconyl-CoA hydratase
MNDLSREYVQLELKEGVAQITFYHPQRNSLPGAVLEKLASAINQAASDTDIRVILLQSGGDRVFCSGASFDELAAIQTEAEGLQFFSGFAKVINAMRKAPQFVIARIQGKCIGGGVGLAATADYAFAHVSADIKLSELAVGIGPFVVGPAVERKMGKSAFSQLAIDASGWRTAQWAMQHGLYVSVHDTMEELETTMQQLVQTLTSSSPEAMQAIKQVLWEDAEHWEELLLERAAVSGRLVLGDYTKNFIAAFKAKQEKK